MKVIWHLIKCIYFKRRAMHIALAIADEQRHYDAWPLSRSKWQAELARLQQEITRTCGKRGSQHVLHSLMPRDR